MEKNDSYTFVQLKDPSKSKEYEPYFLKASEYISNIIWLTNSLLFVLMTCFIELEITLPKNSMVGTFIKIIKNKKQPTTDLIVFIDDLEKINKIVNLIKHSLIGMSSNPKEPGVIFFDLATKQMVHISSIECQSNLDLIQKTLEETSNKLSEITKGKKN